MRGREAWDRLYRGEGRPWKGEPDATVPLAGRVLELGVGNGKGLSALPVDADPIGLDFSMDALLSCRRWRPVPLVQGDATSLPFRDGCFPSVSASHVLGHLLEDDRQKAAEEISRVLEDGGLLYVSVFGDQDMRCGKGGQVERGTFERGNGIICHYFSEGEVAGLFSGLRPEREWERRLVKRYHGREEVRQERRGLFRK